MPIVAHINHRSTVLIPNFLYPNNGRILWAENLEACRLTISTTLNFSSWTVSE